MSADYRKMNDRSLNSSKYHKKDCTNVRAKLKAELVQYKKRVIGRLANAADCNPAQW